MAPLRVLGGAASWNGGESLQARPNNGEKGSTASHYEGCPSLPPSLKTKLPATTHCPQTAKTAVQHLLCLHLDFPLPRPFLLAQPLRFPTVILLSVDRIYVLVTAKVRSSPRAARGTCVAMLFVLPIESNTKDEGLSVFSIEGDFVAKPELCQVDGPDGHSVQEEFYRAHA